MIHMKSRFSLKEVEKLVADVVHKLKEHCIRPVDKDIESVFMDQLRKRSLATDSTNLDHPGSISE